MRLFAILFCLFWYGPALAQDRPTPQLDTGGHMAPIRSIAFTPDGKQLVSSAEDKVIRVWDLASGKTVRSIRGESATGTLGKIFAIALSSDGKWLAAGGDMRVSAGPDMPGKEELQAIRLYDFASGKLIALLKGHKGVVRSLAFSPNGSKLLSAGSDAIAIIWDTGLRSGLPIMKPTALHTLQGHRSDIYSVAFSPDGDRVVTGSYDNDARLWRVSDGSQIALLAGTNKVQKIAIAPDGTIASGDIFGAIRLWDGRDGHPIRIITHDTGVGSLNFSLDGKRLVVTCGTGGCVGERTRVQVYDTANGDILLSYAGHRKSVPASALSPDGRWVATAGNDKYEIHLWDLYSGQRRLGLDGKPLQLGGRGQLVWAAGFSADNRRIGWGNIDACPDKPECPNEQTIIQQALILPSANTQLSVPTPLTPLEAANFRFASSTFDGWSLAPSENRNLGYAQLDISVGEKVVASIKRDMSNGLNHRAYTFTPDGESIISSGSFGVITDYDRQGVTRGDFVGHEGSVVSIAPSPDGRYLASASADETLRLWNLKSRELLVSLFRGTDGEWVMWTPQGYYASSPAGAALIGWQINHGPEREAEYVTAAQLRKNLNRPDIIEKTIMLGSAEKAIEQSHGTKFQLANLLAQPVPRFRILSPAADATINATTVQVELDLDATPDPVKLIRLYVNALQVDAHQPANGSGFASGRIAFTVPLASGRNLIRAVAVNETGETSSEVAVTLEGEGALNARGVLRILAIGVDKYPGLGEACRDSDGTTPKSCDLSAAVSDASAFANAVAAKLGPLYQSIASAVLINGGASGEPKAANILDALDELRNAKPNDTIILFVSGHGFHEEQDYYFVPTDAKFSGGRLRKSTAVAWTEFQRVLEGAKGRRFLFLDTCRSGNRYSQRLTIDAYEQNIVIYAAARWDQDALETSAGGLFTSALIEGINGRAKDNNGEVRAESLRDYARARVLELAKAFGSDQEVQFVKGRDAQDYVLVVENPH